MKKFLLSSLIALGMIVNACAAPVLINGAGATFPYPIYSKWFDVYSGINTDVHFNYQSIGSGGGIKQITEKTVDFGATDAPMTVEQLAEVPGRLYHIPMVMGAVAVTYNIEGLHKELKITPDILAGIFLGKITKWNDSRIAEANPGLQLPDASIVVIHRSDGSGASYIFTDYLSKVNDQWKSKVGKATSVNWPVGLGGKGNEGVASLIQQTPGAIGYVELAYAIKSDLPYAAVENSSGKFIKPDLASTSKAAEGVTMPDDFRVSITNSPNPEAYPLASFTWLLIYKDMGDPVRGKAIVDFIKWAIHDGQKYTADLLYAPLPQEVVSLIDNKLMSVKY